MQKTVPLLLLLLLHLRIIDFSFARDAVRASRLLIACGSCCCAQDLPFDVSVCVFVLEQALSVRALQEMVSAKSPDTVSVYVYSYSVF